MKRTIIREPNDESELRLCYYMPLKLPFPWWAKIIVVIEAGRFIGEVASLWLASGGW